MITRKGLVHFLIVTILLAASIISVSIPIVYAPTPFTEVETLDLYDPVNEARKSVIYGTDLYVGTFEHYVHTKIQKINLTTFTKTANITIWTAANRDIYDMIIDSSGDYLYACIYGFPSIIVKVNLTTFEVDSSLTLASGDDRAKDQVIVGNYLYVMLGTSPAAIVKIDLTSFTRVGLLSLAAGERYGNRLVYAGSGEMIYAVTESDYQSPTYSAARVVRINVTSFTRVDAINFASAAECYGLGAAIDGEFLYVSVSDALSPRINSRVIKINLTSFARVDHLDFTGWNTAASQDVITNGTHGFVHMGSALHRIQRFSLASFTWVGSYLDWIGTSPNGFVVSNGYLYQPNGGSWTTVYKLELATFTVENTLDLYVGINADKIVALESDTTYLYALCEMGSGASKISKVDLATFELVTTQALGSTEDDADGFELYNNYLYVGAGNGSSHKVLKIDVSSLATVDTLILGVGNYSAILHVAEDDYLYAGVETYEDEGKLYKLDPSNLDIISSMWLETGEETPRAMASDGTYLYVVVETEYWITQIVKIDLATFSRVDSLTLDDTKAEPWSCDYDKGYLYVATRDYPTSVSKIDVDTMVEVDFELLPVNEWGGNAIVAFMDSVYVGADSDGSPNGGVISKLETSTLDRIDGLTLNWSNKETDISSFEVAAVGNDLFLFAGIDVSAPAKIVKVYLTSTVTCVFTSSPEIEVTFTMEGIEYSTPTLEYPYMGVNTLIAPQEVEYDEIAYVFDSWLVNGTTYYYTLQYNFNLTGDTTFVLNYEVKADLPFIPPAFDPDAINATWYMRSDTHTIHEILGFKLHEYQSYTETNDTRYSSTETVAISYGVRIWVLDANGNKVEISSGSPVAVVTRDDNSSGILSETWTCSEDMSIIDAVQVKVYQRFGSGDWSLRKIFMTEEALLIRFPESTWTFYYYVEQIKGSTNSTFSHGSLSFNSRINYQYYRINVFEKMTYHLQQFQPLSFIVTPWTYYLGSMFYGILLFFFATTAYLRYQSLRAVLAVFWLFGGTGGMLSSLMPAMGLQISWFILALTLAITIFHLIYGRRT